jgi:hypothetical protein
MKIRREKFVEFRALGAFSLLSSEIVEQNRICEMVMWKHPSARE